PAGPWWSRGRAPATSASLRRGESGCRHSERACSGSSPSGLVPDGVHQPIATRDARAFGRRQPTDEGGDLFRLGEAPQLERLADLLVELLDGHALLFREALHVAD